MFLGPWYEMKKKTQNHHLIRDKKLIKIVIDLGEWFRQNQGPKTKNWDMQPTGGQVGSAQQAALRAPP